MFKKPVLLMFAATALGACARTVAVESAGEVAPATTPTSSRMLPAGTDLKVKLNQDISAKNSHVGDNFTATVTDDVIATNGRVVVPAGSMLMGHVAGLDPASGVDRQASVRLAFDRMTIGGHDYDFDGAVTSVHATSSNLTSGQTAKDATIGGAAGAVLGAILGGAELDKILAGGVLGAAGGTVVSLGKSDAAGMLRSGTTMTVRASRDVTLY